MTMQQTPLLMSRILGRGAMLDPNVEVVTLTNEGTHRQSLEATAKRGAKLAHALASRGIKVGDRIASFMWNNYRHLELYQAVPSMGCVLHTLNIRLSPHDLEYIINHAEDRVIFADEDLLPLLEPILDKIPTVELLVIARHGEAGESGFTNQVDYENFIDGHEDTYEWPEIDENAPMGLCYTSGTTGVPKGALITHQNIIAVANAAMSSVFADLSSTDVYLSFLPLPHIFERMVLTAMLSSGGAVGFFQGDPLKIVEDTVALMPSIYCAVPRLLNKIHDKIIEQIMKCIAVNIN